MRGEHALLVALMLTLATAAHAHDHGGAPEWAKFGMPAKPDAATRTIKITVGDMRYTPNDVTVKKGEVIRFIITNQREDKHEFVIGDRAFHLNHIKEMEKMPDMNMDEANSVDLHPGETRVMAWHFTKAGEFLFGCDIPGHFQAGMVGKLHVR